MPNGKIPNPKKPNHKGRFQKTESLMYKAEIRVTESTKDLQKPNEKKETSHIALMLRIKPLRLKL